MRLSLCYCGPFQDEIKVGGAGDVGHTDLTVFVLNQDVVVHLEPSSASHWVSQWEQSSTVPTTQVTLR